MNSRLDKKGIWGHLTNVRFEYLQRNINFKKCESDFIPIEDIGPNLDKLSLMIRVNSSDQINSNLAEKDINLAAEMFFGLNSCPSIYEKLYWKAIYGTNSTVETAMLASNIIKKSTNDIKRSSMKIFAKISKALGFQHLLFHNNNSGQKNNLMMMKSLDIKG